MTTILTSASLIAAFCITTGSAFAAHCVPVFGSVKLTPDPTCEVTRAGVPGQPPFAGQPGTCFKVELNGMLKGSGFAGLTMEQTVGLLPNTGGTMTPAIASEIGRPADPTLPFGTRQFFTARSVATVSLLHRRAGKIYTVDAGVASNDEAAEQVRIVGGEGFFANASGTLYLMGNSFKGAPYFGDICHGNRG